MKKFKIFLLLTLAFSFYGCASKPIEIAGRNTFPFVNTQTKPSPTVLIAHGCDGPYNMSYIGWLDTISDMGYNTIIVDSFNVRGYRNLCNRGIIVSPSVRATDFEAVALWVKKQDWHKGGIAVIGFSHGGSTALNIANNSNVKNIDAVISFYPYCGKQQGLDFIGTSIWNPRIPAQVHLAEKDDWTPPQLCGKMKNYEVYHYPNATHGFDMPFGRRKIMGYYLEYDKEAHMSSIQRVNDFLERNLKGK